jgi:ribonuclease D
LAGFGVHHVGLSSLTSWGFQNCDASKVLTKEADENQEPVALLPLLSTPKANTVLLVETRDQLKSSISVLASGTGPFAVDAERASGFKYSQRAYLIQIHRRGGPIFLIDPIAVAQDGDLDSNDTSFSELSEVLSSAPWILHAASQDLPCLRELGLEAPELFDTELGSRIAGLPRVGLGAVTEHFLKLRLAKEHSAVDWSTRPMHQDWLNYAALDVDVLHELWDKLAAELELQGKSAWAKAEFAAILNAPPKPPKTDKWRSTTGLNEVKDQRGLAIARSLWEARERLAMKLDVSPGRLIPDSSISSLAKNPVATRPELASNRSFVGRASRSYLDTWWAALQEAQNTRDLPPLRLPLTGIPNHRVWANRFPDANARLLALKPAISAIAEEVSIPLENLLTPDYLRQLAWEPPADITAQSVASFLSNLGAREWQVKLVGEVLAQALLKEPQQDFVPEELELS